MSSKTSVKLSFTLQKFYDVKLNITKETCVMSSFIILKKLMATNFDITKLHFRDFNFQTCCNMKAVFYLHNNCEAYLNSHIMHIIKLLAF